MADPCEIHGAAGLYSFAGSVPTYADRKDRTSGFITVNGTAWADLDNALDLVLTAKTDDWVEVGISSLWLNEAVQGDLDAVSIVSGVPVNSWAADGPVDADHQGVIAWVGVTSAFTTFGGSMMKQLVAGDVDGGLVTIRFRTRTNIAGDKTIFADGNTPLTVWARNHG
jgi:hypothetical protein